MNLVSRLLSLLSKRIALHRNFAYGKSYGSYGLLDEVLLCIDVVNIIKADVSIALDVGANTGDYSALLASRLGHGSVIHCFEPSVNHQQSHNALEDQYSQIVYHPLGLSSSKGKKHLLKDNDGSGLASFYDRDIAHAGLKLVKSEVVSTTTLDQWYKSSGINRITYLKVDVEGHELEVFKGGSHVLSSGLVDAFQFEFGGCNIDSRTYFKDFFRLLSTNYGFKLFRLALGKRLVDMNRYSEALECFAWQNIVGFRDMSFVPPAYTIVYD